MSAEMQAELQTEATLAMMAEQVPVTTDQELHDKMSCPMAKVGCPLCYNIVENWNLERKLPAHADTYCSDVVTEQWRAMYQTLTGKPFINMREKTRVRAHARPAQRPAQSAPARPAPRHRAAHPRGPLGRPALPPGPQCVAIAAGVHEMVTQGCSLGTCSPDLLILLGDLRVLRRMKASSKRFGILLHSGTWRGVVVSEAVSLEAVSC